MNCKYIHNHIYNIHMLTVATGFVAPTLKGTAALNLEISDIAPYRPRDVCQWGYEKNVLKKILIFFKTVVPCVLSSTWLVPVRSWVPAQCVCVWERERERERKWLCVCVCVGGWLCVCAWCVCACVKIYMYRPEQRRRGSEKKTFVWCPGRVFFLFALLVRGTHSRYLVREHTLGTWWENTF